MKQPIHLENRALIGKRLVSPTSERNRSPIGEQLMHILPKNVHVLEIAAGTGQHGHHMCRIRPDIRWHPTDIDPESMQSQAAYGLDFPDRIHPPIEVDVTTDRWWAGLGNVDAIFCANMIHIAPWSAAQGLAVGAGSLLARRGKMCLYGPFLIESGNAESNVQFDLNLKARNPEWGVRPFNAVKQIFVDQGLSLAGTIDMPRNNTLLVFQAGT